MNKESASSPDPRSGGGRLASGVGTSRDHGDYARLSHGCDLIGKRCGERISMASDAFRNMNRLRLLSRPDGRRQINILPRPFPQNFPRSF